MIRTLLASNVYTRVLVEDVSNLHLLFGDLW